MALHRQEDAHPSRSDKPTQLVLLSTQETARPPTWVEPQKIDLARVLIVPKLSKFQYDMLRLGLNAEQLVAKYEAEHAPLERILLSHKAQEDALISLNSVFQPHQFIARNEVNKDRLRDAQLVIAFGGDNHFQFVSHSITDGFLIGVNSDPGRSEGALTHYSSSDMVSVLMALTKGDFLVEEWTRLEGEVNGVALPKIICEYFVGERDRLDMSRNIVKFRGKTEEQKGSGLLIATGAGSSGWYDSEVRDLLPEGDMFARTSKSARMLLTAPFRGKLTNPEMRLEVLRPNDELELISFNDSEGIIGCDALERVPFSRGANLKIRISKTPLKVLKVD